MIGGGDSIPDIKFIVIKRDPKFSKIFPNVESEQFFEFCFDKWFSHEIRPKTALSVFYHYLKNGSDNFQNPLEDLSLACTQVKFASFWNDIYSSKHPNKYKIPHKNNRLQLLSKSEISTSSFNKIERHFSNYQQLKS